MKFRVTVTAVKNFVYNTNLFLIFFIRIRMIGIYNNSRILEIFLAVQIIETNQILIMVIRDGLSILIDTSAEDGMCQIVSGCLNITAAIDEMMRMLGSSNESA